MKTFANLNEHTLPLLYKSLVRPHLEYANVVWGPTFLTDVNKIESAKTSYKICSECLQSTLP